MRLKARIRFVNQLPIKPLLAHAGFVPGDKQNRVAPGIEGKGHAPHSVRGVKAQFLHIRVARAFQGIHSRPPQLRSELLEQPSMRQNLILNVDWELTPFRFEFIREVDAPVQRLLWLSQHMLSTSFFMRPVRNLTRLGAQTSAPRTGWNDGTGALRAVKMRFPGEKAVRAAPSRTRSLTKC